MNHESWKDLIDFICMTCRYAVGGKCRGELEWKTTSNAKIMYKFVS